MANNLPAENWRPVLDALRADWEQFSAHYTDTGLAVTDWRVRIMNLQAKVVNKWMGRILDTKLPLTATEIDADDHIRLLAHLTVIRTGQDGLALPLTIHSTFTTWSDLRRWLGADAVDDLDVDD